MVNPSQVFTGGLPKSVSGMAISHNEEGLVTNITTEDGDKAVCEMGIRDRITTADLLDEKYLLVQRGKKNYYQIIAK